MSMFGPIEREILTQALCRTHGLCRTANDQPPCRLGTACANRPICERLTQRTLDFIRDLRAETSALAH